MATAPAPASIARDSPPSSPELPRRVRTPFARNSTDALTAQSASSRPCRKESLLASSLRLSFLLQSDFRALVNQQRNLKLPPNHVPGLPNQKQKTQHPSPDRKTKVVPAPICSPSPHVLVAGPEVCADATIAHGGLMVADGKKRGSSETHAYKQISDHTPVRLHRDIDSNHKPTLHWCLFENSCNIDDMIDEWDVAAAIHRLGPKASRASSWFTNSAAGAVPERTGIVVVSAVQKGMGSPYPRQTLQRLQRRLAARTGTERGRSDDKRVILMVNASQPGHGQSGQARIARPGRGRRKRGVEGDAVELDVGAGGSRFAHSHSESTRNRDVRNRPAHGRKLAPG
ncbi:hypothetical protein GGX14DRAFT_400800 [Mycena pura]|uniref:Uncharacterized protein n=1 Tax=Mycena pura TaxID=153505 RepID=A0AAD6V1Z2_9AGAR|nr:hypothetical protein GGX14DRAFT_400800 [Mycena pura]